MHIRIRHYLGLITLIALVAACQPDAPQSSKTQATAPDGLDGSRPDAEIVPKQGSGMQEMAEQVRDTTPVDTRVVGVRLSNHGDTEQHMLGAPTTRFAPTDTVYAAIESEGTAKDYTIYAKWIGADGMELADYGIREDQAGRNLTVISLSKPDGWPKGTSRIEISVNGKLERTVTFQSP